LQNVALLLIATGLPLAALASAGLSQFRLDLLAPEVSCTADHPVYRLRETLRVEVDTARAELASGPMPDSLTNKPFAREIERAARDAGIDPVLVHVVVEAESGYRQEALSPKGAVGLMQLLPGTAARYGVDPALSAQANLKAGASYLRDLSRMFDAQLDLVLAAYHAGEGSVKRNGNRVPAIPETQKYVRSLLEKYGTYRPRETRPGFTAPRPAARFAGDGPRVAD
jgi:soluble lytic murein transglycosylase-like protein